MDLAPYSGAMEAGANLINAAISRIWPDKTKALELQNEVQKLIIGGQLNNELAAIQSVNATMQAEEANKSPWYSWRHMIGYAFAAVLFNNYILAGYLQHYLTPIAIPSEVWNAMMIILGAAAAGHSWEQVAITNQNGKGK